MSKEFREDVEKWLVDNGYGKDQQGKWWQAEDELVDAVDLLTNFVSQPAPLPQKSGFICAEWKQISQGPILSFKTMSRKQYVYRCDLPEGHEGDHVDQVLLVNWKDEPTPLPSDQASTETRLGVVLEQLLKADDRISELEEKLCVAALPSDQPLVKETTYSIRVSGDFVKRVESRIGMGRNAWDVVDARQLCEEIIAEYQAALPIGQKDTFEEWRRSPEACAIFAEYAPGFAAPMIKAAKAAWNAVKGRKETK